MFFEPVAKLGFDGIDQLCCFVFVRCFGGDAYVNAVRAGINTDAWVGVFEKVPAHLVDTTLGNSSDLKRSSYEDSPTYNIPKARPDLVFPHVS